MSKILLLQIVYRGSYVFAAWLFVVFWNMMRRNKRFVGRIFLIGFWLFVWARWGEPQSISVREQTIDAGFDARVVLLADTHLGVYKDEAFLSRVVQLINESDPDIVLIAGDHTYEPVDEDGLHQLFAPLSYVTAPVYTVLGNHDVERPGPDIRSMLIPALEQAGVVFMNNDIVEFPEFTLAGLGAHLNAEDDVSILRNANQDKPLVVMTHNPDTTLLYTGDIQSDYTLVGHTHCGQVRIPYLYKRALPVEGDFDCGWYDMEQTSLFITPGLGEVMLPLRFLNPPTIDILEFRS